MQLRKLVTATSAIVLIAFVVAILPFDMVHEFDPKRPRELMVPKIHLLQANANPIAVAGEFSATMAEYAGLSLGDFVATCAGIAVAGTGYNITKDFGVTMGATAAQNLNNLIDSADYPAWSTLGEDQQQLWGSQENYESAKFNSFMGAFGMAEDRDNFYSSGGGNFEFSDNVKDKLQQIGRIGNLWKNRASASISDLINVMESPEEVAIFAGCDQFEFDGSNVANWPTGFPRNIGVGYGTLFQFKDPAYQKYYNIRTSRPVYTLMFGDSRGGQFTIFDKFGFTAGYNNAVNPPSSVTGYTASECTRDGDTFYLAYWENWSGYNKPNWNVPYNQASASKHYTLSEREIIAHAYLYGKKTPVGLEKIADYPEEPEDNQEIYFPNDGITPTTNYINITVKPETPRQENQYNPGNQTGTDEWKDETEGNLLPLMGIQFDKLFPFCLLFDIQKLFDKVQGVSGSTGAQEGYLTVSIPLDVPGFEQGETLDLNLQWLHDLLITVRPFVQILLGAGLLFVTIRFWQGVLTG